jgi:hypothetical protein
LILIVIAVIFVGRREAQLMAEAERALPGPLKNRRDRPGAGEWRQPAVTPSAQNGSAEMA